MEPAADALGTILLIVIGGLLAIGLAGALVSRLRPRRWDFFFSYKSENANEVRRVAERLMAGGYRVWFAEYEVLLRSYDQFERRIRRGTGRCSYAVLFTTARFAASAHCRAEVGQLVRRFANEPHRLIEVSLEEPNDARRALGLSPAVPRLVVSLPALGAEERGEDDRLLAELSRLTGLDLARGGQPAACRGSAGPFRARCAPIRFDASGFDLEDWKQHPVDGTDVASFVCRGSQVRFSFNAYFHFAPQQAPAVPFTVGQDPLDDRVLYRELRAYASWWMGRMRRRGVFLADHGLHLVWLGGRTQLALSHSVLWVRMRKYSLILSELPQPVQVILTFGVTGTAEDFWRMTPLMDRVVASVRVGDFSDENQPAVASTSTPAASAALASRSSRVANGNPRRSARSR